MFNLKLTDMFKIVLIPCVLVSVYPKSTDDHQETKRLLLSDPDIVASRLAQIEKNLQDMTRITTQLQTETTECKFADDSIATTYTTVTRNR